MQSDITLVAIVTGGILIGLAILVGMPVVLGIRHSERMRELEHQERMKALELGRPWPGDGPPERVAQAAGSPDGVAKIGVWVPLGALGIALAATSTHSGPASETDMAIWISAASVGLAGVICGTILAMGSRPATALPPTSPGAPFKPPAEEDALDLVSRRG